MQKMELSAIKIWRKRNDVFKHPLSVSTNCPYCIEKVNFNFDDGREDTNRQATSCSSRCPSCSRAVHFWTVLSEVTGQHEVFMYPPCLGIRPVLFAESNIPTPLHRAYESTVQAFNSKNYPATAVCCRRTLEGIFKYLLPDDKKNVMLANAITEVSKSIDLAKPLHNLSHSIRHGGNLGAHFDMEKEPDADLATAMVDLLEYLIEYLYTLPNQIEKLDLVLGKDQ